LIEAEAIEYVGANRYERSEGRTTQRNGYRDRLLSTKAGDINLKTPKMRKGSFFPSVLERRRRVDRSLFVVVMEAYVQGVSTRKVEDLVAALGAASGISKSEVSRICTELDTEMEAFRTRRLRTVEFPYVFADATYLKGRLGGRVVSRAVVLATGVSATGEREALGTAVGDTQYEDFWSDFFLKLRSRGLGGVRLEVSDHRQGLKAAITRCFVGASWQRCRVHFMRNALAKVLGADSEMVASAIRTIFA
jgi:putative transposase